jgi:hypothetical protein
MVIPLELTYGFSPSDFALNGISKIGSGLWSYQGVLVAKTWRVWNTDQHEPL